MAHKPTSRRDPNWGPHKDSKHVKQAIDRIGYDTTEALAAADLLLTLVLIGTPTGSEWL